MAVEHRDGLRVGLVMAASDDHTLVDLGCLQGLWTPEQYLRLTDACDRLLEFTDGRLEVLPMPTDRHQAILQFLFLACLSVVEGTGGVVRFAPLRLRIGTAKFREPDLLLVRDAQDPRRANAYWSGADLVMEVVSPDGGDRDRRQKRTDYAEAAISEYWIVDPLEDTVTVLVLEGDSYAEYATFHRGDRARSVCLPGLGVDVAAVFDAE